MPDLDRWLADPQIRDAIVMAAVQLLVLLIATLIALRFVSVLVGTALGRLFAREVAEGEARDVSAAEIQRRRDTLDGLVGRALRVIIIVIAFLMALQILRLDIGPAIAGLGLIGLALSLGAQHLVRDYVAGAFVLIENQYSKGDVVTIAGITGDVEDVSLRRTTLRDLDGTLHFVPHGLIETASNKTRSWARVHLDVPVPYGTPLDKVRQIIDGAGEQLARDEQWAGMISEPPRMLNISRFDERGMMVKVLGMVRPPKQWPVAGEMRRLILEGAEREGISLGWPVAMPETKSGGRS
jgi:moderate conductance mechanosensitive channel